MSIELYYTAPSDEVFEEIKAAAIKIWQTYDDTYGYVTEKIGSIERIGNVKDNWMFIVAMFDWNNQAALLDTVRPETAQLIKEAMK